VFKEKEGRPSKGQDTLTTKTRSKRAKGDTPNSFGTLVYASNGWEGRVLEGTNKRNREKKSGGNRRKGMKPVPFRGGRKKRN